MIPNSDVDPNEDMSKPLDPTTNPMSQMGETYGLTGLQSDPHQISDDIASDDVKEQLKKYPPTKEWRNGPK